MIRPVVKVFLHVSGTTCDAHQVILDKLEKLQSRSWRLEVTGDWRESDLFLVFCPAMTRPGADVEAAMRKLPGENFLQADLLWLLASAGGLVIRASDLLSPLR